MTHTRLKIQLHQSTPALDGWLTVSFQEVTLTPKNGVAFSVQRTGHVPDAMIRLVGEQCALTWRIPGKHVLISVAALHINSPSTVAEFDVRVIDGPMPTAVGPLSEDELKILGYIARADVINIASLRETMSIVSVLEKRKLRHSLDRLRSAKLIDISDHHNEEHWAFTVTPKGVAYLVDSGLA